MKQDKKQKESKKKKKKKRKLKQYEFKICLYTNNCESITKCRNLLSNLI